MSLTNRYGVSVIYIVWFLLQWLSFPGIPVAAEVRSIDSSQCLKCHKRNGNMLGLHANQGLAITCEDCHGQKGKHPRKDSKIIRFGVKSDTQTKRQVEQCLACHDHEELAQAYWTHNVHATRVSCAQCHQLHSETDPALTLIGPAMSQSCAKCHQDNH